MHCIDFIEFLCACHVACQVDSPFTGRGGVVLSAPPEHLKTTMATVLDEYPNALVLSDINGPQLDKMRQDFISERWRSIVFTDYQKVWERDPRVSSNVEGCLRAMIEEGWSGPAHKSNYVGKMPARAFLLMCMTTGFEEQHGDGWATNGFMRRLVWCRYRVGNHRAIIEAIKRWKKLELSTGSLIPWTNEPIPHVTTDRQMDKIELFLKDQQGEALPLQLLAKAHDVLDWHYKRRKQEQEGKAWKIIESLAPLLSLQGGVINVPAEELPPLPLAKRQSHRNHRKVKGHVSEAQQQL
jgi:hypothetical protein